MASDCPLCCAHHPEELWRDDLVYIIAVDDADLPGYIRVILTRHKSEMSDLSRAERHHVMDVVNVVETTMRETLHPDKVNLAEFGNMVPHLHWHVIPRFRDDAFFPECTWGPRQRTTLQATLAKRRTDVLSFHKKLVETLTASFG